MKILIVGCKGSEHALAWKLRQSARVSKIYIAPGNAGTVTLGENLPLTRTTEIVDWLKTNKVDLVLTGSVSYLAEGLADEIEKLKVPFFGPTKAAAQIEWSKSFAKKFMRERSIPTAPFEIFSDVERAKQYVKNQRFPMVIKADGLASGLGTIIAKNLQEAELALYNLMVKKIFGRAGEVVVIEEFLEGREISIHAFCDGDDAVLFPASQDHKRLLDGDMGPNTGGMGSITPVPWVASEIMDKIKEKIVLPTLRGLKRIGRPFIGILYPGVIITPNGPMALELNARFGDPETQSYMRILKTDLHEIIAACIEGKLDKVKIEWESGSACCVALVSAGYPSENYKIDVPVFGLERLTTSNHTLLFYSNIKWSNNQLITSGPRVISVSSTGLTLKEAINRAYQGIDKIHFDGMYYRKDIGEKALLRLKPI